MRKKADAEREKRRFTSCSVRAKVVCRWSSSGGSLPWRYWETREGGERRKQETPSISRANHHPKVPATLS